MHGAALRVLLYHSGAELTVVWARTGDDPRPGGLFRVPREAVAQIAHAMRSAVREAA